MAPISGIYIYIYIKSVILVYHLLCNFYFYLFLSEEQLSIIADKTISEADVDGDGLISFEEFSQTFEKSDIEHKMSIRFLN